MNRTEYLYFAIQHKCYFEKRWIVSIFTECMETEEQKSHVYIGKIIREPFGVFYLDEHLQRQPLDIGSLKPSEPLYSKKDTLTISSARLPWIGAESIETTVGKLLVNLIAVFEPFEGRLAYVNDSGITPSDIEKKFIGKLQDELPPGESKKPGFYYVDELIKFQMAVTFLEGMSKIFASSITRQGVLPAPGAEAFRKEILKKYEGKLHDPTEMVRFQTELNEFDKNYLKQNDPSYGKFMAGKVSKARAKAYMTQGGDTNGFSNAVEMTPITQPLIDGIDLTPEKFVAISNTIRYGSFSRGAETVNGGVTAKALMTALDTWKITDRDCGSQLGALRTYNEGRTSELVGRYIIGPGNKPLLIETKDQAVQYAGKEVNIRSPQYCRETGTHTCKVCAGIDLARFGSGLVIPAMEVSSGIMSDSLKKMHDTTASSKAMVLSSVIS